MGSEVKQGYGNFALCVLFAQPWTPWRHCRQSLQNTMNYEVGASFLVILGTPGYPEVPMPSQCGHHDVMSRRAIIKTGRSSIF